MRLLIVTQKVDAKDDVLGFFHNWIKELSAIFESITVICLYRGSVDLPSNVKILSLGKENYKNINESFWKIFILKLGYVVRFYFHIWKEKDRYDTVFVHMNHVYVLLGGLFWRLRGNKLGLWYVHKKVSLSLHLAVVFVDRVFTSTQESFLIKSDKVRYLKHGIDTDLFQIAPKLTDKVFRVIYVGRISRIKNQDLLVKAFCRLIDNVDSRLELIFYGEAISDKDRLYKKEILDLVEANKMKDVVTFAGSVPNFKMPSVYQSANLSINLCPTGGLDKAVIESLSCGVPALVFNKAFLGYLPDSLIIQTIKPEELASALMRTMDEHYSPAELRRIALHNFSLASVVGLIKKEYESI